MITRYGFKAGIFANLCLLILHLLQNEDNYDIILILCSMSTFLLQTTLEILRLRVKREILTKLQFLFLLGGLVSELEES
jgi:hypothetical protein